MVAKEGSIRSACEKLFVTQSTVSDQIKLLEEYFNCNLFERRNRGLFLTKSGELALEYAHEIFQKANELTSLLRNEIKVPKQSLDIGVTPYMSQFFRYDLILPLFEEGGHKVNFKEAERGVLLSELYEESLDIIFTINAGGLGKDLKTHPFGVNKTYVIVHKKYKKFKTGFPHCLEQIPYFSQTSNSELRYHIELFFSQHDINPVVIGESDDTLLMRLLVEQGKCFIVAPECFAQSLIAQNKELIILGELSELQSRVWAITRKDSVFSIFEASTPT